MSLCTELSHILHYYTKQTPKMCASCESLLIIGDGLIIYPLYDSVSVFLSICIIVCKSIKSIQLIVSNAKQIINNSKSRLQWMRIVWESCGQSGLGLMYLNSYG